MTPSRSKIGSGTDRVYSVIVQPSAEVPGPLARGVLLLKTRAGSNVTDGRAGPHRCGVGEAGAGGSNERRTEPSPSELHLHDHHSAGRVGHHAAHRHPPEALHAR